MPYLNRTRSKTGLAIVIIAISIVTIFLLSFPAACAPVINPGDVNEDGKVDVRDVVAVMKYVLNLRNLTDDQLKAADLNGDGIVDVRDVTRLMQVSLELIDQTDQEFKLGSEVLFEKMRYLVQGKKVGLVTNQSGVNSRGESTIDLLHKSSYVELVALYGPEHGIDGKAAAGEYVESYTHPELGIPVYSLYGKTRMPTGEMLSGIDLLIYDIQDIGARSYTYISTLNYCMVAAEKYNIPVVILDRPNPLGGLIVDGPMMEERFKSFVGVDILPMAHGMTAGELGQYFNRNINADLTVVPMEGYDRSMIFQDTGLSWVQTSPNIPDIDSVFGYMTTGLGENTGVFQADQFKWIGGRGLDENEYASILNDAGLTGIEFIPERRGEAGGVRLKITDYHLFSPARTGIYALTYAFSLADFNIPKSNETNVMFDLIMGTAKMGEYLEEGLSPQEIEALFTPDIKSFKEIRKEYLLPQYNPE
ncbi:MAG: DUF1343 domain-containing protein [Firmicutes bacterium]|nr:DUF1343 domain-containing protein [Bacillota bacterium]